MPNLVLSSLSEQFFHQSAGLIGTPTEVAIRREMMDMEEIIERPVYIHRGCMIMKSGSHREGFRFTSCAGHQISD